MKKLLLIATGGTIACQKTEDGLAPQINPEDFLAYVPEYKTILHDRRNPNPESGQYQHSTRGLDQHGRNGTTGV